MLRNLPHSLFVCLCFSRLILMTTFRRNLNQLKVFGNVYGASSSLVLRGLLVCLVHEMKRKRFLNTKNNFPINTLTLGHILSHFDSVLYLYLYFINSNNNMPAEQFEPQLQIVLHGFKAQ